MKAALILDPSMIKGKKLKSFDFKQHTLLASVTLYYTLH